VNEAQKRMIALALYAIALVLFGFFFGRGFWEWLTWNRSEGTFDLGVIKVTTRPSFPSDAKSVIVGLILPIALATAGRVIESAKRA
jgi:hypothetical protein